MQNPALEQQSGGLTEMSRKGLDLLLSASLYLYFENHHSLTLSYSGGARMRACVCECVHKK